VEKGVSQHWTFVPGHRAEEIATLCSILDVGFEPIRGG
jgi:hypothetical protein